MKNNNKFKLTSIILITLEKIGTALVLWQWVAWQAKLPGDPTPVQEAGRAGSTRNRGGARPRARHGPAQNIMLNT